MEDLKLVAIDKNAEYLDASNVKNDTLSVMGCLMLLSVLRTGIALFILQDHYTFYTLSEAVRS